MQYTVILDCFKTVIICGVNPRFSAQKWRMQKEDAKSMKNIFVRMFPNLN